MTLTATPGSIARLQQVRFAALALLGLVIGHDAVFVAQYPSMYQEVLSQTGHGYWLTFLLLTVVVAGVPLAIALLSIRRLGQALARRGTTGVAATEGPGAQPFRFAGTLARLFTFVVIGFVLRENAEQLLAGHTAPGLNVLDSQLVLPVLFLISLLLTLAGSWLRWREGVLRTRLAAAEAAAGAHRRRPASQLAHPRWVDVAASIASNWLTWRRSVRPPPISLAV